METMTATDKALDAINRPVLSRWRRAARLGLYTLGLLMVFGLGAVVQNLVGGWWAQRKLDRANLDAVVLVLQYNLQKGRLEMPPQLAAAPTPPPAPTTTKPAEPPAEPSKK